MALELRSRLLRATRDFFAGRGYLEAEVPILSPALIPEAHIPSFRTFLEAPDWDQDSGPKEYYLLPSPEIYLKRLLASGSPSLFCISRCFRNKESFSERHSPEFTMLEFYTRDADYHSSLELMDSFLKELPLPKGSRQAALFGRPIRRMSMEEAFQDLAGLALEPAAREQPEEEALEKIRELCEKSGLRVPADETWDDMFQRIFLSLVEPKLPQDAPLALLDYPWRVRTTARRKGGTAWAERWELYLGGMELANVYTEENDPESVREYLRLETQALEARGQELSLDRDFAGIASRLPLCSGAALGFDRLVMLAGGYHNIREVLSFPLDRGL